MKNVSNNGTLFITSAMAVTLFTLSLFLFMSVALLRNFDISSVWLLEFDRRFDHTEMALLGGALFLLIFSIVRCFSGDKPLVAFAGLMFFVGFVYLIALGIFGIVVFGVLQSVLGIATPYWSILPGSFAFFLMLRMVLNYRHRSRKSLAEPVVTVVRLSMDG